jgi:4-hydroxy-3-methylbut-2-enyl diphosphate reductase
MATITVAEHAGFCFGVKNAIKLAEEELEKAGPNGKVYCLGPLIHNKEVLKELGEKGLVTAECPDDVPEGDAGRPAVGSAQTPAGCRAVPDDR